MDDREYDATKCFHCGDTWEIKRIPPVAPGAKAVDLRICSCDLPHCKNPKCRKPVRFDADRCPHCGSR